MINGKMWLVVKPTVGVPLLIGAVALTSLAIHTAVLTNTTWYPAFYQGSYSGSGSIRPRADVPVLPTAPAGVAKEQR